MTVLGIIMIIIPSQIMLFFFKTKRYLKTNNCADIVGSTYLSIGHTKER